MSSFYLTYAGYEVENGFKDPFYQVPLVPILWYLEPLSGFAIPFAEKQAGRSFASIYHADIASLFW